MSDAGEVDGPEVYRFPAVIPRETLVRTDYLRSFPDLVGSIHGFDGNDRAHAALLRELDEGADWSAGLTPDRSRSAPGGLLSAVPDARRRAPRRRAMFDVLGTCFRREPSDDPARMQSFHMHEFVHVGTPESALAFRDGWLERSQQMMADLGLRAEPVVANDPFFGRAGSMLAANQRESALKFELVATVSSEEHPTAIVSCNCHLDHLTVPFGISSAGGGVAHSACVGFGLERIVLGLFAEHGLDPERWPHETRKRLWQ